LYRHSCPYLDGLSTQWVLEEYRRAHEVYQEHLQIIDLFDGHLKVREERIRILERRTPSLKPSFKRCIDTNSGRIRRKTRRRAARRTRKLPRRRRRKGKSAGRRQDTQDGDGPTRTILTGPLMCLLRRSAPIVNPRI
jgi:hypothetical protein